jgi:hypothetical protein
MEPRVSALLRHGLDIGGLEGHAGVPWEALPGQAMVNGDCAADVNGCR